MSPRIKNYLIITWSKGCYLCEFKCACCLIFVGICCKFYVYFLPCHLTSACNCGFLFCISFFFSSSCWSISAAAMSALWLVMFINIESLLKNVAACEQLRAGAVFHLQSARPGLDARSDVVQLLSWQQWNPARDPLSAGHVWAETVCRTLYTSTPAKANSEPLELVINTQRWWLEVAHSAVYIPSWMWMSLWLYRVVNNWVWLGRGTSLSPHLCPAGRGGSKWSH